MKGIILAGGLGTRLHPITKSVSKQLLPIYDKPMIYYSLSVLLLSNIRDILLISTPKDISLYELLLGDGSDFGVNITYQIQDKPGGISQAFILGKKFIEGETVALVLGDNIFYGYGLSKILSDAANLSDGAHIFGYRVSNPSDFGVVEFSQNNKVLSIHEKPKNPNSNYAVTGLYYYDKNVYDIASSLKPSARGELEITDVNNFYLEKGNLICTKLGRGISWLDTGTHESLIQAGQYIQSIETRQGLKVACLEEIAYRKNWITNDDIKKSALKYAKTSYGEYLSFIANHED